MSHLGTPSIAIGKTLILSPPFPTLHTVLKTFTAHCVPSIVYCHDFALSFYIEIINMIILSLIFLSIMVDFLQVHATDLIWSVLYYSNSKTEKDFWQLYHFLLTKVLLWWQWISSISNSWPVTAHFLFWTTNKEIRL